MLSHTLLARTITDGSLLISHLSRGPPRPAPALDGGQVPIPIVATLVDKYGNRLDRGGVRVDAKALGAAATSTVEDRKDGTCPHSTAPNPSKEFALKGTGRLAICQPSPSHCDRRGFCWPATLTASGTGHKPTTVEAKRVWVSYCVAAHVHVQHVRGELVCIHLAQAHTYIRTYARLALQT